MHLEPESEKRATNIDLHTAKNNTFSLFLDEFLETDLRPIYCSLTTEPPIAWRREAQREDALDILP